MLQNFIICVNAVIPSAIYLIIGIILRVSGAVTEEQVRKFTHVVFIALYPFIMFDNLYGTPKEMVLNRLERGRNIILDIDVQGALQVRKAMPEAILIFILPPSLTELRKRLEGRGTESADKVEKRIGEALNEIRVIGEYDYYLVNDDLDSAVERIRNIMTAESLRVPEAVRQIIRQYEKEV